MAQKKKTVNIEEKIISSYMEYLLENGSNPPSVFKFMKDLKLKESDFYEYFNSFIVLENKIWEGFIVNTLEILHGDDNYATFSSREKMLAFYYTFIEIMKDNRSYVLMRLSGDQNHGKTPLFLKSFKNSFKTYVEELIIEGQETGEIATRKFIDRTYSEAFWVQLQFVMKFWANDNSKKFEKTDEAIEKAVNLSFEMIGEGPLEQIFDFAKFLYQNR